MPIRGTIFRNEVEDLIEQVVNFTFDPVPGNPGPGGTTTNNNVDDALLQGGEFEITYDAPKWFLSAGYSRTRGDNKTTNQPLTDIQPDKWVLAAGYRFSVPPAHASPKHAVKLHAPCTVWLGLWPTPQQPIRAVLTSPRSEKPPPNTGLSSTEIACWRICLGSI